MENLSTASAGGKGRDTFLVKPQAGPGELGRMCKEMKGPCAKRSTSVACYSFNSSQNLRYILSVSHKSNGRQEENQSLTQRFANVKTRMTIHKSNDLLIVINPKTGQGNRWEAP